MKTSRWSNTRGESLADSNPNPRGCRRTVWPSRRCRGTRLFPAWCDGGRGPLAKPIRWSRTTTTAQLKLSAWRRTTRTAPSSRGARPLTTCAVASSRTLRPHMSAASRDVSLSLFPLSRAILRFFSTFALFSEKISSIHVRGAVSKILHVKILLSSVYPPCRFQFPVSENTLLLAFCFFS